MNIEKLRARRAQLDQRIRAALNRESKAHRRLRARGLILLGAELVRSNPKLAAELAYRAPERDREALIAALKVADADSGDT